MFRYYFDVHLNNEVLRDVEGTEFPNTSAAEVDARMMMLELLRERQLAGEACNIMITIRDEQFQPIVEGKVDVSMTRL